MPLVFGREGEGSTGLAAQLGTCKRFQSPRQRGLIKGNTQSPKSWPAQLLLGLDSVNSSKNEDQADAERGRSFIMGTKLIEYAFNANQRNASAANALCDILVRKGKLGKVRGPITLQFHRTNWSCHRQ